MQVTQVARALAGALGLNDPLVEAVALGHDVGHTPFGHAGEEVLASFIPGWQHGAQGVRIYDTLEPANLTWEVGDGIRAHTWKVTPPPATPEGQCVRWADRIAYLTHDARDAIRAGLLAPDHLPPQIVVRLGPPSGAWIGVLLRAVVDHTIATDRLGMEPETAGMMRDLRAFMFERVYLSGHLAAHKEAAMSVTRRLVEYHLEHPDAIPDSYREHDADPLRQVTDYVAGMTDRFALSTHAACIGPVPATALVDSFAEPGSAKHAADRLRRPDVSAEPGSAKHAADRLRRPDVSAEPGSAKHAADRLRRPDLLAGPYSATRSQGRVPPDGI